STGGAQDLRLHLRMRTGRSQSARRSHVPRLHECAGGTTPRRPGGAHPGMDQVKRNIAMAAQKNSVASKPRPRLRTVAHHGSGRSLMIPAVAHTRASTVPDRRKLTVAAT